MLYVWALVWIHPSLGLLATASGTVLMLNLLCGRSLSPTSQAWWAALYVATAVACGAVRFAFPIETKGGPSILLDVIPLVLLPVMIITLYLLRLAGLWNVIYSVRAVLGVHVLVSIIPPLVGLPPVLPLPPLPELAAFGWFALMALSRWTPLSRRTLQTTPPMARVSQNLDHSLTRAIALAEKRRHGHATSEHLLLALTDDVDAVPVMQACHVDMEALRRAIASSLAIQGTAPEGASTTPRAPTSRRSFNAPWSERRRLASGGSMAAASWWRCWPSRSVSSCAKPE